MNSLCVGEQLQSKQKKISSEEIIAIFRNSKFTPKIFTKMFQTCQNQPDFGSTKPKCATLKKS